MAQMMPLPLTVSSFSKIQIGLLTFLVLAHQSSHRKRAVKRVCWVSSFTSMLTLVKLSCGNVILHVSDHVKLKS